MNRQMMGVVLACLLVAACGNSMSSGKTLAKVNGEKITEGDLTFLGDMNPRLKSQVSNPAGRKRVLENLVEQDLLYQEAIKQGLSRDPLVKAKADLYRRVIIGQALVDANMEKSAKKYYDEHNDEFKKLGLSHIMISYTDAEAIKKAKGKQKLRTEKESLNLANQVKVRLEKGEEFAKVAAEVSDDASSKRQGGSLGKVAKNEQRFVSRGFEPLLEKAFELQVGQTTGPIKTSKGYHMIMVTDGVALQTFDEVKDQLMAKVGNNSRTELIAHLKKKVLISYPEEEKAAKAAKEVEKKEEAPTASTAEPQPAQK